MRLFFDGCRRLRSAAEEHRHHCRTAVTFRCVLGLHCIPVPVLDQVFQKLAARFQVLFTNEVLEPPRQRLTVIGLIDVLFNLDPAAFLPLNCFRPDRTDRPSPSMLAVHAFRPGEFELEKTLHPRAVLRQRLDGAASSRILGDDGEN